MAAAVIPQTPRSMRGQGSAPTSSMRSPRSDDGASSHRMGYFDKYPARATPGKTADDNGERILPKSPSSLNGHAQPSRKTRTHRSGSHTTELQIETDSPKFAWPSKPLENEVPSRSSSPESLFPTKSSQPSTSHSKSRARDSAASTLPELRHSASTVDRSSLSPPQTPIVNHNAFFSPDTVVVAAPVPGVEMMDALVDGMNGITEHSSSDGNEYRHSRSRRHSAKKHLAGLEKRLPGLQPYATPPLPKPPSGVKLGTPKSKDREIMSPLDIDESSAREPILKSSRSSIRPRVRSSTNADTSSSQTPATAERPIRRGRSSSQLRNGRPKAIHMDSAASSNPTIDQIIKGGVLRGDDILVPKSSKPIFVPSIDDIIRQHAPELSKIKPSRNQRPNTSPALPTSIEESEHDDRASRSSIDSVTHEVQSSLQKNNHSGLHHARSFPTKPPSSAPPTTFGGYRGIRSSESEHDVPIKYAQSVYSASSYGFENASSVFPPTFFSTPPPDSAMAIAQFLRSPRLTRLLTLRKLPHRGLTVSLADVGNPNGLPVLVFLGLGCVRYLIALYDEMAEALGLRLIAIDRWGMGRTGEVPQERRGLKEWAAVCEEVLDTLQIKRCGILAHSAGAPYALAFALRMNQRVMGSIHLLAPWVGGGIDAAGYKWLKYVPNSFIKAAQNAEWKVHGWKLGKPPTIVYEGIGFDPKAPVQASTLPKSLSSGLLPLTEDTLRGIESAPPTLSRKAEDLLQVAPRTSTSGPRPSLGAWSDYDDLADFEGRFGSHTTLPTAPPVPPLPKGIQASPLTKRKVSDRLLSILKSPNAPSPSVSPTPTDSDRTATPTNVKSPKLKGLRSISSLKDKFSGSRSASGPVKQATPKLETTIDSLGGGLGIDMDFQAADRSKDGIEAWASACAPATFGDPKPDYSDSRPGSPLSMDSNHLSRPRRSLSLTAPTTPTSFQTPIAPPLVQRANSSPAKHRPLSGNSSTFSFASHTPNPPRAIATTSAPTSSVATALLRASHKEAQKGLANDLLSILERDAKPWGFSYADVRHKVKVWYGDKDEKIGEAGIRWMERIMKDCQVTICKGKDHSLMTNASVVVEALESLQTDLREDQSYS
ncbi:hypothetical protein CPB86DRAFT_749534 [Serendipita vermifera]|nr:hypothetical protein CPB86DRAFT_749534 [Serendipita vermifera]